MSNVNRSHIEVIKQRIDKKYFSGHPISGVLEVKFHVYPETPQLVPKLRDDLVKELTKHVTIATRVQTADIIISFVETGENSNYFTTNSGYLEIIKSMVVGTQIKRLNDKWEKIVELEKSLYGFNVEKAVVEHILYKPMEFHYLWHH